MIKNKKVAYLSLGIILAAFFVFVGTKIGNNSCGDKKSSVNLLETGTPDQCGEKIRNMDNSGLTKYILDLSSEVDANGNPSGGYFKNFYNMDLMSKYLSCQYKGSDNNKEKNDILENEQAIIKQDTKIKEKSSEIISPLEENFKNPEGSFLYIISSGDFDKYCPEKLPNMCKRENGLFFKEKDAWCENVCSILKQYQEDKSSFDREVVGFSNSDDLLKNSIIAYMWRINFAYGLEGEEKAYQICELLSSNLRTACLEYVKRIRIRSMKCDNLKEELVSSLCEN